MILYWVGGRVDGMTGGWVAGFCETITSSASAKAEIEARAELGNSNVSRIVNMVI